MIASFSGTRTGLTWAQMSTICKRLAILHIDKLHHGDCRGADFEMELIAKSRRIWTVSHPPISSKLRAFCKSNEVLPPKDFLPRNQDIVDAGEILVAGPKEFEEQRRGSGTWYTIRYAVKRARTIYIAFPDGTERIYFPEKEE